MTEHTDALQRGIQFEREVAEIYRTLGARRVVHNTIIDGTQIDLVVENELPSGSIVLTMVECKAYSRPVGVEAVHHFSLMFKNLHYAGRADKAALVSSAGFTAHAKQAAASFGIELLEIDELRRKAKAVPEIPEPLGQIEEAKSERKYVFVLMPFEESFDDVFWFGIRGGIEDAGLYCKRVDEIQYTGGILEKIIEEIRRADIIVAETTGRNANVFYEVGVAHTLGKKVVLLVQDAEEIPFDLRAWHHIVYGGKIKLLREKLATLLRKLAG